MNSEQKFFLKILSQHINNEKSEVIPDGIDLKLLVRYAQNHQLAGITYYQLSNYFKDRKQDSLNNSLKKYFGSDVFSYINRKTIIGKISEEFSKQGIPFFFVKGVVIAELYPKPELRSMGDADIIIRQQDRTKSHNIMLGLGLTCPQTYINEWVYVYDGMEFEIHTALCYDSIINTDKLSDYFNNFWQYVYEKDGVSILDINFHFLYLIFHIRKHILYLGVGFRQFLDIAVLVKNKGAVMNWVWITEQLECIGLLEFAKVCFALIERWFDVKSPIESNALDDDFFDIVNEKTFDSGVFGFSATKEQYNGLVNIAMKSDKGANIFTMVKLALSRLFPGYDEIIKDGRYRDMVYKKPYKLPMVWVLRQYRSVKNRGMDYGVKQVKNSFASKKTLDGEIDIIKKWGL